MPQNAGYFQPSVWSNPRPPTMGFVESIVAAVAGGDGRHIFKRQPEPGARAWALLPTVPLQPFNINGRGGYIVGGNGASQALSGPQVLWGETAVVSGFTGQVYGGAYQQGLIAMEAYYSDSGAAPVGPGRG